MIFSILALALFMAVFVVANVVSDTAHDLALSITLHADAAAGIPTVDRNGNKWSDEQLRVLRAFAKAIWEHKNGGKPISIAVSAVAGSGKTSLLQGMTHIVAKLAPELLTAMTAFNTHIAASSKDILIQFKSTDGLNIKIFGGRNTVNAGGRGMLLTKAKAEGFSDIDFPSYGNDRYARLARLTLAGWLGRADRLSLLENARDAMEVKTTSHAFNNMIGDGLVKAANIAMDEGYVPKATVRSDVPSPYVPPTPAEEDVKALATVIHRVGVNQSWDENPARNLGDRAVFELVVEILAVAIETAFMNVELKPFCGEGKSFMDAYVPFKKAERKGGWELWQPIAPVRKQIFTTDPAIIKKAQFAILENGGCRFPPASNDGKGSKAGVKAVSFDTEAKAIVKKHNGHIIMSFENGGHAKRVGGKAIGTQFGNRGNHRVNGEFISSWRRYSPSEGLTIVKPDCLGKVVAFLTEQFGDEFHNMLDEDVQVEHEVVEGGKGTLVLSMADMIYLPHALDLQIPIHERADVIFVDEAQDLSVLKANLVWRLAKEDAHKIMVADNRQAIYLFAGASANALSENAENIGATFYPQTISWRGTEMVAASARHACRHFTSVARDYWPNLSTPDYDAHRSPLEAGYDFWPMGAMPVQITANELIKAYHKSRQLHGEDTTFGLLCRVKKPLAGFILHLIKNGIPVSTPATVGDSKGLVDEAFNIANKDRMKFLDQTNSKVGGRAVVGLGWKKQPASKIGQHSLLLRDLENIKKGIVAKYTDMFKGDTKSMAQSAEFQELMGNVELLEAFVSLHRTKGGNDEVKGKNLSSALQTWVEETLFSERGGAAVHIATIHRYKGDEADVMFVVNEMLVEDDDGEKAMSCFMSSRSCEASPESAVNEISMGYVAYTRAKKQNIIINVDLQGEVCSDVEQRLQAAFDLDVEALTTNTVQEPQATPESDSGATDEATTDEKPHGHFCTFEDRFFSEGEEYVRIVESDGEETHWSMDKYDDYSHTLLDEMAEGRCVKVLHMMNGEVIGTFWERDEPADLDRCVECSTIIAEDEEYGTCSKCGGHLCRKRMPDHHTNAGDVSDLASCGSYVGNISLDEMMNGDEATLEAKRTCTACSDEEATQEDVDERFESIPKGSSSLGGEKFTLVAGDEKMMKYRVVEGDYINMELIHGAKGCFWRRPPKNNPLKWVENTLLSAPSISQRHAVFYLNRHDEKVEDIHAFVVGLFKEWVHTKWDGHWIVYDVDSDDPAKGLPKAIDVLLKEDA